MRLCDTDIERYLDDGIISLTPRPNNDKINGGQLMFAWVILSVYFVNTLRLSLI